MKPIQSKFAVYEENVNQQKYFNKLVDQRAFFEVFPEAVDYEYLEPARRQIATYAKGNIIDEEGTMMRIFEKNSRRVPVKGKRLRWKLFTGPGDIRGTVTDSSDTDQVEKVGLGNAEFSFELDVEWFGPNDLVIFEGLREFPIMITSEPEPSGSGYNKYYAKLWTDSPAAYLPQGFIKPGLRVMQSGSLIGEGTVNRGNVHFNMDEAFIEFEVMMTRMGFTMKVTDEAQLASKHFMIAEEHMHKSSEEAINTGILINDLDTKFMARVNRMKDLWLTYGRSAGQFQSAFLDGITSKPLQSGPGLFEFMEASYVLEYPIESNVVDFMRNIIPPLWVDKVPVEQRYIDVHTGEGGLKKWAEGCAALDEYGVIQESDINYQLEEGLFGGRQGISINKKQYRGIFLEPFGHIRVHYLPFLDSFQVETRTYKGYPITSYEYLVFNYGYGDGDQSNIYLADNEDKYQFGYGIGLWSPLGPVLGNQNVAGRFPSTLGSENAFEIIHECEFGMVIKDPSAIMWVRPAFAR